MKKIFLIAVIIFISVFASGCSFNPASPEPVLSEAEQMGVYQQGSESDLNGIWTGYRNGTVYQFNLSDGKVIESWFADWGSGWVWHFTGTGGYIGYYSFDGTDFAMAANEGASGAPITSVTGRYKATLSGTTLDGQYSNTVTNGEWVYDKTFNVVKQ